MSVTCATSHCEMSPLKLVIANKWLISVTLDTSHSPIGPCTPVEQSPSEERRRHARTDFKSSNLDCGANTEIVVMPIGVHDIDPGEPLNMKFLVAFEWTQAAPQSCCLNEVAPINMRFISFTLDTSQNDMSLLNSAALLNMLFMFVTRDTSHFEISPLKSVASNI